MQYLLLILLETISGERMQYAHCAKVEQQLSFVTTALKRQFTNNRTTTHVTLFDSFLSC